MNAIVAIFLNGLLLIFGVNLLAGIHADSFEAAVAVILAMGCANGLMKTILQQTKPKVSLTEWFSWLFLLNFFLLVLLETVLPTFHIEGWFWIISFTAMLSIFNLLISEFELLGIQGQHS